MTTRGFEPGERAFARPGYISTTIYDQLDITDTAFYATQIEGAETFQRFLATDVTLLTLEDVKKVLPPEARILHDTTDSGRRHTYARTGRGGILVMAEQRKSRILVSGASAEVADALRDEVHSRLPTQEPDDGHVSVLLTHHAEDGTARQRREVKVPAWPAISRNYPETVREQLGRLMVAKAPLGSARLILWHGEPGTGKTTALRALLHSWKSWCSARYVMDPEAAFGDPGYLMDLLTGPAHPTDPNVDSDEAWQLFVAEDADEFLRTDARQASGAALGRLLNLTDGILGQGSNTLILLSTNEPVSRLHPALVRPGRCLARIDFTRFSADAAQAWLADGTALTEPATLAELYQRKGMVERIGTDDTARALTGQYL